MKNYKVNYIDLDTGETLAYRQAGKGEKTVLLLHGNMSSSVHFQTLMEKLEEEYRVYALDLVGFGDSTYNRRLDSLRDFAEDVISFIKKLDLVDIYILGWSTGGGIALEVAAEIPNRIRKIFLLSSVGIMGYPIYKKDASFMPILSEPIFDREEIANDPLQVAPVIKAFESNDREFFRSVWDATIYNKVKPSDEDYEIYLDAILKQRNFVDVDYALANFNMTNEDFGKNKGTKRVSKVHNPVVIIQGEDDMVVDKSFAELTHSHIRGSELILIKDAGHSIITDKPDELVKVLTERID